MIWVNTLCVTAILLSLLIAFGSKVKYGLLALIKYTLIACLLLWASCLLFYALEGLPLLSANPIAYLGVLTQLASLNPTDSLLALLPLGLMLVTCVLFIVSKYYKPERFSLYGDAHWASAKEVRKMGLMNDKGNFIIGKWGNQLLKTDLTNHLLMFAPSRSGKGVSTVIPNALEWQESLIVTDNKFEVYEYTSGYRKKKGHEVYRFSPTSREKKTHCINPLDYIDRDDPCKRIGELQLILDILVANRDKNMGDDMWVTEARSLALGILLWLMQSERPFTLGELASICKGGAELTDFISTALDEAIVADNLITLDSAGFLALQNFLQKAEKEQSGVRSTLVSMLRLWEDPLICAATAKSDVDFRDFRKRKITLYLSFGTNQIGRLAPLINIITQMFLNAMTNDIPKENEPYKVLALLDEIVRFGRMEKLKDGYGDLAGYGVHLVPIIQNIGQFLSIYGGQHESDIFFQNTDIKLALRQNAQTDKEFISKELGTRTMRYRTRNYSSRQAGSSYSETFAERALLRPQEVGRFSKKHSIIITGDGVVKSKKIIYYKDKNFKHKILPPATVPTVTPVYPTITIKKLTDISANEAKEQDQLEAKRARAQAQALGAAIASSIKPLVDKAVATTKETPPYFDRETGEIYESLAKEFEGE